jgi:5'-3' exonuclease
MYITGRVTLVITEDSDLLAFGVKKCFYKMNQDGDG